MFTVSFAVGWIRAGNNIEEMAMDHVFRYCFGIVDEHVFLRLLLPLRGIQCYCWKGGIPACVVGKLVLRKGERLAMLCSQLGLVPAMAKHPSKIRFQPHMTQHLR